MAKVTGPLMSLGGSGSLAKTFVVSKWKGRPYIRQHVIPANPNSTSQQETRSLFSWLQGVWKLAPTALTDPWNAAAQGQVLTGRNLLTSQGVKAMRTETDIIKMVFSPGAKGGPAASAVSAVGGGSSGEIDVTITPPSTPPGWTLAEYVAVAIASQNPQSDTQYLAIANSDAASPVTISGLTGGTAYEVGGFIKWTKPDGTTAYGASLNATATATA